MHTEIERIDLPLTPEAVFGLVRWSAPQHVVRVRGRISSVRAHQRSVYGTLTGESVSLRFRIPTEFGAPPEGRESVITGVLSASPGKMNPGLEILLTGHWEESIPLAFKPRVPLHRKRSIVRLHAFLSRVPLSQLHVLATATGLSDAETSYKLLRPHPTWRCSHPSFGDKARLIEAIGHAKDGGACALGVVRGGGTDNSLAIWDDPDVVAALLNTGLPIYTALGHSTDTLLADRYADEFFSTPSSFGSAVAQAEIYHADLRRLEKEVVSLRSQIRSPFPLVPASQGPDYPQRSFPPAWVCGLVLVIALLGILLFLL